MTLLALSMNGDWGVWCPCKELHKLNLWGIGGRLEGHSGILGLNL